MKRGFLIVVVIGCLISIAVPLLSGCSKSSAPLPTLNATEIIGQCAGRMEAIDSLHIEITQVGGTTPLAMGLEMSKAAGDVVRPDRLKGEVTATVSGLPVRVEVITVGNMTFLTNPLTGKWEPFPSQFSAAGIFDPDTGIAAVLRAMTNLSKLEDQNVAGLSCYHIKGNITTDDLAPITRLFTLNSLKGVNIASEIWCDEGDFLLRQIRLEGQITAEEKPGIIRTITLSDFNENVEIELPK
jgi:hypothetical protein